EILHMGIVGKPSDLKPAWYEKGIIQRVQRHGKHIILTLLKGQETGYLAVRLGMSGQLLRRDRGVLRLAHTHAVISFVDRPFEIHFRDPRRFGRILMLNSLVPIRKGVDPLTLRAATFKEVMIRGKGRIKATLMNQNIIAGIGNIYANEILFEVGLHPQHRVERLNPGRLHDLLIGIKKILRHGIMKGGTTIRDFRSLSGMPGQFQQFLKVYGQAGKPCARSGCTGIIHVLRPSKQAQPSFYCPRCQRKT
ncbi:MAG: Fpg/Nei family DNA glycosylase, partial [Nitrospiria bacterium]